MSTLSSAKILWQTVKSTFRRRDDAVDIQRKISWNEANSYLSKPRLITIAHKHRGNEKNLSI